MDPKQSIHSILKNFTRNAQPSGDQTSVILKNQALFQDLACATALSRAHCSFPYGEIIENMYWSLTPVPGTELLKPCHFLSEKSTGSIFYSIETTLDGGWSPERPSHD